MYFYNGDLLVRCFGFIEKNKYLEGVGILIDEFLLELKGYYKF